MHKQPPPDDIGLEVPSRLYKNADKANRNRFNRLLQAGNALTKRMIQWVQESSEPEKTERKSFVARFIGWNQRLLEDQGKTLVHDNFYSPDVTKRLSQYEIELKEWAADFRAKGGTTRGIVLPTIEGKRKTGFLKTAIYAGLGIAGIYAIAEIIKAAKGGNNNGTTTKAEIEPR